jgi:Zn-finger protein
VYFDISHINHSCVRNAELEVGDSVTTVIANRLIAKGEEVTICYHSMYDSMTKRARGNIMRVYYDFECSCPACTLPRREQMLSDVRRSLLNVLTNAVVGKQPMDLGFYDALRSLGRVQAEQKRGVPVWPLEKPLTLQQETAYNVLIAGLLTAEGLSGIAVPRAYLAAAKGLYLQIVEDENWMLVQSAAFLRMWSAQARDGTKAIRTAASEDYVNVQNFEEGLSRDRKVKIAWDIVSEAVVA